jgi:hypothetical protein
VERHGGALAFLHVYCGQSQRSVEHAEAASERLVVALLLALHAESVITTPSTVTEVERKSHTDVPATTLVQLGGEQSQTCGE